MNCCDFEKILYILNQPPCSYIFSPVIHSSFMSIIIDTVNLNAIVEMEMLLSSLYVFRTKGSIFLSRSLFLTSSATIRCMPCNRIGKDTTFQTFQNLLTFPRLSERSGHSIPAIRFQVFARRYASLAIASSV